MKKTERIGLRIRPDINSRIEKEAFKTGRNKSDWIERHFIKFFNIKDK